MLRIVAEHGIKVAGNRFHGLSEIGDMVRLAESGKMSGKGLVVVDALQVEKEGTA